MSRRNIIVIIVFMVVAACLALVLSLGFKRSIPGRIVRFFAGEPGAVQVVEDLAEDVLRKPELADLQQWGTQTLARYSSGQLATAGPAQCWPGTVKLAPREIPASITNAWREQPEVSICVSDSGQPECVVISWYLSGLVVAPPEYAMTFRSWYSKQVRPGVHVYHLEK